MNPQDIVQMITDFFTSVPWENVVDSFIGSVEGIDWDALGSLFDWLDFSDPNGAVQQFINSVVAVFTALFGGAA